MAKKILIIEDDLQLLHMYHMVLSRAGYQIATALDGDEGLTKIKTEKPDLILLDIMLPVRSGIEILEELHRQNTPHAPIVCMSAIDEEGNIQRAKQLGAKEFLIKTEMDKTDFIKKVTSYL